MYNVPDPVDDQNVYDLAVAALDEYFQPQNNAAFERSQFRAMVQLPSETVDPYITRLRQKAVYCDFHNVDENIRDQIIEKCYSQRLRRKLLERNNVTLPQVREIAQAIEASELSCSDGTKEHVNKVSPRKFDRQSNKFQKQEGGRQLRCYACGREGHIRTDAKCPAKGKKCRKCKKEGHFEVCCKTDTKKTRSWRRPATVRSVESDSNHGNGNDDVYVFTVNNGLGNSDFFIEVEGVKIPVIVDSGVSVNVIDRCM